MKFKILKRGSFGKEVKELQENLNLIMDSNLTVDGIFGKHTENILKRFQYRYYLLIDGKYGKESYNKIKSIKDEKFWRYQ